MSERASWPTTTHSWARDVDPEHLDDYRRRADELAPTGVLHLVLEVLAQADDEAESQGTTGRAAVTIEEPWVRVADDGRGTDTRRDEHGRPIRKPVMATADVRFQDAESSGEGSPAALPDGHPRRGLSLVAALSTELIHQNRRREGSWAQTYRHGHPESELVELPAAESTGTTVSFRPEVWNLDDDAVATLERLASEFTHLEVGIEHRTS